MAGGLPLAPARTLRFETSEGTWMSVDVSPDGSTIVFDLAGDLYTVPIDGYPGAEHSYPIAPLYKDAIEIMAKSGITYTPTFLVDFGGPSGEEYFYTRHDITRDAKLARFTPRTQIIQRALRRDGYFRQSEFAFQKRAREAARIVEAGGKVGLGDMGSSKGWLPIGSSGRSAAAGWKPHDLLRVGTIFGAEATGFGKSLGAIEPGKIADILVRDANALADITNTNTIRFVMKNGRLYDAGSLDEPWPRQRKLARPWWWDQDTTPAVDQH